MEEQLFLGGGRSGRRAREGRGQLLGVEWSVWGSIADGRPTVIRDRTNMRAAFAVVLELLIRVPYRSRCPCRLGGGDGGGLAMSKNRSQRRPQVEGV